MSVQAAARAPAQPSARKRAVRREPACSLQRACVCRALCLRTPYTCYQRCRPGATPAGHARPLPGPSAALAPAGCCRSHSVCTRTSRLLGSCLHRFVVVLEMMDAIDLARLRAARHDLRDNLVFDHIAAELLQEGVLDRDEYQRVNSAPCDAERVDRLLDLLPEKGSEAFRSFINALEHDYPWLVDALLKDPQATDGVRQETDLCLQEQNNTVNEDDKRNVSERKFDSDNTKKSEKKNTENTKDDDRELTTEMMNVVRRNYRAAQGWTSLAHTLGLTKCINNIRMRVLVYGENSDVCVQYLLEEWVGLKPKEAKLNKLISALREEGFNDVADYLEANYL
ncbi:uncharacterized protein LOC126335935 [Schistocerca gregaria]|uniref:uncharacterized protein LOC126335935 n=1 Tax=Schistocerca gregaria TaxID=7010 RepID=UPI00211DD70F|nr:uncharacterized protein LOC126335935 [Schistocerca gregaria]